MTPPTHFPAQRMNTWTPLYTPSLTPPTGSFCSSDTVKQLPQSALQIRTSIYAWAAELSKETSLLAP
eukprot:4960343-Pyramimonas_sp.AAC.1